MNIFIYIMLNDTVALYQRFKQNDQDPDRYKKLMDSDPRRQNPTDPALDPEHWLK
jgi:hypothetical protein